MSARRHSADARLRVHSRRGFRWLSGDHTKRDRRTFSLSRSQEYGRTLLDNTPLGGAGCPRTPYREVVPCYPGGWRRPANDPAERTAAFFPRGISAGRHP